MCPLCKAKWNTEKIIRFNQRFVTLAREADRWQMVEQASTAETETEQDDLEQSGSISTRYLNHSIYQNIGYTNH